MEASVLFSFFFFNDTATTEIYTLSLHDALPIFFVLFSSQDEVKKFVNYMNDLHPNIKFTYDIEKDHTFSFLDVKITRENNHFSTSVYRKPTFSGVYSNFNSFIRNVYKYGLINTLLFRGFNICSSYEKFHQEVVVLKEFLKLNSFPERIIDYNIKKF